ncbi:MAG TPA: adenylate/guanylate cyclase domain-containing protein, partial [Saprospiraceae bacterium]|nr:adenylate/guanylate cyclase domain-containing protein [Saprospiraceae bacterium]
LWAIENTTFQRFHFPLCPLFLVIAITGLLDGVILGLIDIVIDSKFLTLRFAYRVLVKTWFNLVVGLMLSIILVTFFMRLIVSSDVHLFVRTDHYEQLTVLAVYFLFNTIIVQFIKLAMSWMKTREVMELIAHPYGMEENRIFLSLDMKSSTSLAEQLDQSTYSHLLRECFNDMSLVASETSAQIYQYVGDQAVMTWKESPENFIQAVEFHFRFQQQLKDRGATYLEKFGANPEFKAGIHHGMVIKAQVGMMWKEIAYHGDTINTASRIQGKCTELQRHILVSESFKNHIADHYHCQWEGRFAIRGKLLEMNLFSVFKKEKHEVAIETPSNRLRKSIEWVKNASFGFFMLFRVDLAILYDHRST